MGVLGGKEYRFPLTVEFEDVDSYRIVHHTKLVAYLERARLHLFDSLGVDVCKGDATPVLYDLRVRYMKPARLLDQLTVVLFVKELHDYRLVLGYRILRGDETLLRATTSIAFADLSNGGAVPAPEAFQQAMARFLSDGEPASDGA